MMTVHNMLLPWATVPPVSRHDLRDLWRALAKAYDQKGNTDGARLARWAAAEVPSSRCRIARSTMRRQARLF